MKKIIIILVTLLVSSIAYGNTTTAKYQSLKSKGMGGTSILSEASDEALLSNPAMLNLIDNFEINIFGVDVTVGDDTLDLYEAYMDMMDEIDGFSDEDKVIKILTAYLNGESTTIDGTVYNSEGRKIKNKKLTLELTDAISFVKHNFGLGIFTTVNINDITLVDNPSSPQLNVDLRGNVEVPLGLAYNFGNKDQFSVGGSLRYIIGGGARKIIDSGDIVEATGDDSDTDIKALVGLETYSGMSFNLGSVWKTNKYNYALSLNDIFSSLKVEGYDENGNEITSTEKLVANVSIAISNKYYDYERTGNWFGKNIFWTAELNNIFNSDIDADGFKDNDFWKKIHLGTEGSLLSNNFLDLDLRLGLNQGYFTFGFGTELFSFLNIEYANFTKELGSHLGMKSVRLNSLSFNFRI